MNRKTKGMLYFESIAADKNYDPESVVDDLIRNFQVLLDTAWQEVSLIHMRTLELFQSSVEQMTDNIDAAVALEKKAKHLAGVKLITPGPNATSEEIQAAMAYTKKHLQDIASTQSEAGILAANFESKIQIISRVEEIGKTLGNDMALFALVRKTVCWFSWKIRLNRLIINFAALVVAFVIEFVITTVVQIIYDLTLPTYTRIATFFTIFLLETILVDPKFKRWEKDRYTFLYNQILGELHAAMEELYRISEEMKGQLAM